MIRSGFGIYWQSQKSNDVTQGISQNPPFIFKPNLTSGATPTLSTDTLFPPIDVNAPIPTSVELSTRLKHEKPPYSPEWNFTVEHQFGNNWLLQVAYQGASLIRGGVFEQGNPASYDPTGRIPIAKPAAVSANRRYQDRNHQRSWVLSRWDCDVKEAVFGRPSSGSHVCTLGRSIDDGANEINNTDFPLIGRKLDKRHRSLISGICSLPAMSTNCLWAKAAASFSPRRRQRRDSWGLAEESGIT